MNQLKEISIQKSKKPKNISTYFDSLKPLSKKEIKFNSQKIILNIY